VSVRVHHSIRGKSVIYCAAIHCPRTFLRSVELDCLDGDPGVVLNLLCRHRTSDSFIAVRHQPAANVIETVRIRFLLLAAYAEYRHNVIITTRLLF